MYSQGCQRFMSNWQDKTSTIISTTKIGLYNGFAIMYKCAANEIKNKARWNTGGNVKLSMGGSSGNVLFDNQRFLLMSLAINQPMAMVRIIIL